MNGFYIPWVSRSLLRTGLGLALGMATGVACNINVDSVFTCTDSQQCIDEVGDPGALCEVNNLCTQPDAACDTGKRWHERAGQLGGKCYEESDLGGETDTLAGTAGSGSGGSGSGDSGSSSTTGPVGSTTNPVEDSGDAESSGDPPMTDDGGSSSTGTPASCDDLFGAAEAYELCMETDTTCKFNVTLNMTSCDDLCVTFGSTCATAFTNSASDCASEEVEVMCSELAADNICVCMK